MTDLGLLRDLLILFGLGVFVVVAVSRLRVPPIVGFLLTGVLCGPHGFGLIRGVEEVEALAEIGVVLLLFTVGIEFSMQQFVRMRSFLLAGGGLQIGLTLLATAALARLAGVAWNVAIFLGMLVALSSTAIVLRVLAERGETDAPHGRATVGVLIFQDLCVVPMVLLTPFLAGERISSGALLGVLLKAGVFLVAALAAARIVVPRLLGVVVATRKREIFLLTIVLICLGTAYVSSRVGLSLALGAFLAGLIISESEYSHQALGEVLPLREVFNSLFFLSIGMLFDVGAVVRMPALVLGALGGVVLLKAAITVAVVFALGQSLRVALLAGLGLAQIGEFSFVLSKEGLDAGLLTPQLEQVFLATAVGSMALTPLLHAMGARLASAIERVAPERWSGRRLLQLEGDDSRMRRLRDHVIIVGYGLNGRNLARVLSRQSIPFVVIELNPDVVRAERARGRPIVYGDATHREILGYVGLERARVLVIAISDAAATRSIVAIARQLDPNVNIIVRTRYVAEIGPLLALGTNEVVPEEFETSVEIFSRVLRRYLVPRPVIEQAIQEIRHDAYDALRGVAESTTTAGDVARYVGDLALETFRVAPRSALDGRSLQEAQLRERAGVTAVAIRQAAGETVVNPSGDQRLTAGDAVTVVGRPEQIASAGVYFESSAAAAREA